MQENIKVVLDGVDNLPNLHAIEVKYLPYTNTKTSRVKITSHRFKQSVIQSYDHSYKDSLEQALYSLNFQGFTLIGVTEISSGFIILSSTFKPLK